MRDLFVRLCQEGEAGILKLVDERSQETVTLDFKRKVNPKVGKLESSDRAILGELISAFANSAGGLGVWGVKAIKGEDGVDCAQSAAPITDIELFKSEVQRAVGELLMPRHDGIEVVHIPQASVAGSGYLLVCVDRSDRRPHRSEAKDVKQYFKRAGDSSYVMEHYDIEDAFSRTVAPVLEPSMSIAPGSILHQVGEAHTHLNITVVLRNTGPTIAKFPYLYVSQFHKLGPYGNPPTVAKNYDGWFGFSGGADVVIHPGQASQPIALRLDLRIEGPRDFGISNDPVGVIGHPSFAIRGGCEGARQIETTYQISYLEVLEQVGRIWRSLG